MKHILGPKRQVASGGCCKVCRKDKRNEKNNNKIAIKVLGGRETKIIVVEYILYYFFNSHFSRWNVFSARSHFTIPD